MAKRRTRKQKESAKRWFETPIIQESGKVSFEPAVKGQFEKEQKISKVKRPRKEIPEYTAKVGSLSSTKREIVKSLIFASLILGLEFVIYLAWIR